MLVMRKVISNHQPPIRARNHYPAAVAWVVFIAGVVCTLVYWVAGVVFILLFSTIAGLFLKPDKLHQLGHRTLGVLFRGLFRLLMLIRVVKIDDADLMAHCHQAGPMMIASNHPSLWDAPILIRRFDHVACIMKASLLKNPILSGGARFAGFVPNRPRLLMVRMAAQHLSQGGKMLIFPEGTRTRREHGEVNPFRSGLALISKKSGVPILPVFMLTDSHYMGKGWPIWKRPPLPITVITRVGALQEVAVGETTQEFSDRLERYYRDELARLREDG